MENDKNRKDMNVLKFLEDVYKHRGEGWCFLSESSLGRRKTKN